MYRTTALLLFFLAPVICLSQDPGKSPPVPKYSVPDSAKFTISNFKVTRVTGMGKDEVKSFEIGACVRVPSSEKPDAGWPAVLFISGSGSQSKHGLQGSLDLGSHELLDAIANAGFVVMSSDDRGIGDTPLGQDGFEPADLGYNELIGDARAVLDALLAREDVNKARVFVVGHSEGGLTAPILAGEKSLAGVVFMAAAGRNMYDVTYGQVEDANAGMAKGIRDLNLKIQKELQDAAKEDREPNFEIAGTDPKLVAVVKQTWQSVQPIRKWWHDHFNLDVPAIHADLTCPCLITQGASDFQVKPDADAKQIMKNLLAGKCTDATLKIYDDLDHLFKPCNGRKSEMNLYYEDRRVDARFITDVVSWLEARAE
ncbi:MAG: alpha/beta fold hydrolase [Planctomycetes bacterium]|nr:alpha/beta fold hydrolase [Planctomycetota bacterium]